ncbi:MAG TPA: tetratricopeptide repeat protein, partial [Opitutales bacterium]|nr:tetratricopeptide repeat protein [Opitutales bacterium]
FPKVRVVASRCDYKRAVELFRIASDQFHAAACYSLGLCYSLGHGVEKDENMAVFCYKLSSDKGNLSAIFNLGLHYYYGRGGLEQDKQEALQLFDKAAKAGHDKAKMAYQSLLAEMEAAGEAPADGTL